jgi:Zn-dependent protease
MTDPKDTVRRGPWDRPADPAAASPAPVERPTLQPDLVKGQHLAWALVSTLALAGLIWFLTGSVIVAGAAIFGLFVHEYGHVLAMNRYGMGPARIYIVPFFGGFARGQRGASSEWDGVKVSLAGPAFGLLAAIPFFGLWAVTGMADWLLGAFIIAIINLVNLAPAPPLDGSKALGPVLARVHPGLEKVAMVVIGLVGVAWGIMTGFYFLAIVLGIALLGHLKHGVRVAEGRPLSARESGLSLALFLISLIACAAVAVAALTPVAGSIEGSIGFGLRYLGVGR